jgi:hypothetical protein
MKKIGTGSNIFYNQPLEESYGIDIADQLSSMLSEELAKQIDKEILQGISNLGKNNIRKRKIENILKSFE